jgi:hypothetical protein
MSSEVAGEVLRILESSPLGQNSNLLLKTQCERAGISLDEMRLGDVPKLADQLETALVFLLGAKCKPLLAQIRALASEKEIKTEEAEPIDVRTGEAFIVSDPEDAYAFRMFRELAKRRQALCISRKFPEKLKETYRVEANPRLAVKWLSKSPGDSVIGPADLDLIRNTLTTFLAGGKDRVAILDGMEYLLIYHDFNAVAQMLGEVADATAISKGTVLVPINPLAFSQDRLAAISRQIQVLSREQQEGVIDELFLIHKDGRLIVHLTRRIKPTMDQDIMSSMLVAMQNFVKDSYRDDTGALRKFEFGNSWVAIEPSANAFLGAMFSGKLPDGTSFRIRRVLLRVEERYGDRLKNWDGNPRSLDGVQEMLKELLS